MMINRHRGEISAVLNGSEWVLCLTLGALAELEAAYETEDLSALIARFSTGKLGARDMLLIVTAGLRGGGNDINKSDVASMRTEDGAIGFARIVTELLVATFGDNNQAASSHEVTNKSELISNPYKP